MTTVVMIENTITGLASCDVMHYDGLRYSYWVIDCYVIKTERIRIMALVIIGHNMILGASRFIYLSLWGRKSTITALRVLELTKPKDGVVRVLWNPRTRPNCIQVLSSSNKNRDQAIVLASV